MVEEKVYYKYLGQHSQGQRHLGECRVDITRLIWALRGERDWKGKGREGSQESSQEGKGTKRVGDQNAYII